MFGPNTSEDPVTIPPTLFAGANRAWKVDLDKACALRGLNRADDGTVASWIVEAPWAHPVWHSYWICLVHLRPMPDGRKTMFYLEGATHEIWVYALAPDQPRTPMIERMEIRALTPKNFAAQFIEASDQSADARVEAAVLKVVSGALSPDTDFMRHWMHLFGDNMVLDKAHAGETKIRVGGYEIIIPPQKGPQDLH